MNYSKAPQRGETTKRYFIARYKAEEAATFDDAVEKDVLYVRDFATPEERAIFHDGLTEGMDDAGTADDFCIFLWTREIETQYIDSQLELTGRRRCNT